MNQSSIVPLSRRSLMAGAAGSAALIAGTRIGMAQTSSSGRTAVIDVNRARADPIPIAIPGFTGSDGSSAQLGQDIANVVTNDLAHSGLFRPIAQQAYIQAAGGQGDMPNFQNWKAIGAQALVTGRAEAQGGGQVRLEFRLWDVLPQSQLQGTAYTTTQANWRRIAHIIADVIYERLLGEKGYFDTRIVYIAATGPRGRQTKRLAIMDQDSENNRYLTDGSWMVLTPRFHPTRDEIAFMSYANNRPRVYLFNLGSGQQRVLGDFPGMTFAPRFAPGRQQRGHVGVHATVAPTSSASILAATPRGGLPTSGSIDVSPCYSPDGSQIVFNSDRGGDQQLYVMGAGGGGARRISFGSGRYATPVWSPRGDLIAFTRFGGESGNFSIGVMHPDGSGERILSEGFSVEGPTFAPERPRADVLARNRPRATTAGPASRRGWSRSISPASTNGW